MILKSTPLWNLVRVLWEKPAAGPEPEPTSGMRVLLAFNVAALTPGLLVGVSASFFAAMTKHWAFLAMLYINPFVAAFFGLFVTVPAILIAGIPTYLLFLHLGWTDLPRCLLGGAAIGWLVPLVVSGDWKEIGSMGSAGLVSWVGEIPFELQLSCALLGAASVLMLWYVIYTRRPRNAFLGLVAVCPLVTWWLA